MTKSRQRPCNAFLVITGFQQSINSSYLHSRRRSKTFDDDDSEADSEIQPLLLEQRLRDLLRAPKDIGKKVSVIFCYLGMCSMLPWNMLVSITGFWNFKFRDVSFNVSNYSDISNRSLSEPFVRPTDLQQSFPSYLAIASCIPGAIATLLHSIAGQKIGVGSRLLWSLSILLTSFMALLSLSIPDSDEWQYNFLNIVLTIVVFCNIGVSVLQGSLFGISGRFPPHYVGCVMTGQALGGVIPAAAAVGLIAFEVRPDLLGPTCFVAIVFMLGIAIYLARSLKSNEFFLYFAEGRNQFFAIDPDHEGDMDRISYLSLFCKSFPYLLSGYLNYAVALSVFPGVTSLVESSLDPRSLWSTQFFKPVAVLLYNISDLFGRTLATALQWPGRTLFGKSLVMTFTIFKIGIIPLVIICNAAPATRKLFPILIYSDFAFYTLIVFQAVTVGYLGNLCLIHAPKTSNTPESQEATSLLLTASFVFGQATGSFLSYEISSNI